MSIIPLEFIEGANEAGFISNSPRRFYLNFCGPPVAGYSSARQLQAHYQLLARAPFTLAERSWHRKLIIQTQRKSADYPSASPQTYATRSFNACNAALNFPSMTLCNTPPNPGIFER